MSAYVGYIYKITNNVTGKIYVGKRQKSEFDKYYWGSGTYIGNSIKCYGVENFSRDVLEWCHTIDYLLERERFWIEKLDARNPAVGYNLSDGGQGSTVGGKANANYCYVHKDSEVLRIFKSELESYLAQGYSRGRGYGSNGLVGRKATSETRSRMSAGGKGKHNNSGKNNPCYGSKFYWANDGKTNKRIGLTESLPEGFVKGKIQAKYERTEKQKAWDMSENRGDIVRGDLNPARIHVLGKHLYNNGVEQRLFADEEVPKGWVKGKIK